MPKVLLQHLYFLEVENNKRGKRKTNVENYTQAANRIPLYIVVSDRDDPILKKVRATLFSTIVLSKYHNTW